MPRPELATCQACQTRIWFIHVNNSAGRPPALMPLTAGGNPTGNVAVWQDQQGTWRGRVLRAGETPAPHEKRYLPHFADCPNAAELRRQQWRTAQADRNRHIRNRRGRRPAASQVPDQPGLFRLGDTP